MVSPMVSPMVHISPFQGLMDSTVWDPRASALGCHVLPFQGSMDSDGLGSQGWRPGLSLCPFRAQCDASMLLPDHMAVQYSDVPGMC